MIRSLLLISLLILPFNSTFGEQLGFQEPLLYRFFDAKQQTGSVEYSRPGEWEATSDSEWLLLETESWAGLDVITFNLEANLADKPRIAVVAVGAERFEIIQNAPSSETVFGVGDNSLEQIVGDGEPDSFDKPQIFWSGAKDAQTQYQGTLILNEDGKLWGKGNYWSDYTEEAEHGFRLLQIDVKSISSGSSMYLFEKNNGSLWVAQHGEKPVKVAEGVLSYGASTAAYYFITNELDMWAYNDFGNIYGSLGENPHANADVSAPVLLAHDVLDGSVGPYNSAYVTLDGDLAIVGVGWWGIYKGVLGSQYWESQSTPVVVYSGVTAVELDEEGRILIQLSDDHLYEFHQGTVGDPLVENARDFGVQTTWDPHSKWAINADGEFFVWGNQNNGELGIGSWERQIDDPRSLGIGAVNYTRAFDMGIIMMGNGDVAFAGQDRLDATGSNLGTMPYPHIRADVRWAYQNGQTSLFLSTDHELYLLGRNEGGKLVDGGESVYFSPEPLLSNVQKVAPVPGYREGEFGLLVLDRNGAAFKVGRGSGSLWQSGSPGIVEPVEIDVIDIASDSAGENYYYVDDAGRLFGVGSNSGGQLGTHPLSVESSYVPLQIATEVSKVMAYTGCVVFIDHSSRLWGVGDTLDSWLEAVPDDLLEDYQPTLLAEDVADVSIANGTLIYRSLTGDLFGLGKIGIDAEGDLSEETAKTPVLLAQDVISAIASPRAASYLTSDGDLIQLTAVLSTTSALSADLSIRKLIDSGVTELISDSASGFFYKKDHSLTTDYSLSGVTRSETSWLGFERTIRILAEEPWVARSESNWIELLQLQGEAGISDLSLQVKPNYDSAPRIGYISLSGKRVQVYQQAADLGFVTIAQREKRADELGGNITVEFESQSDWLLSTDDDWISADVNAGTGSGSVELTIAANESPTLRIGELSINSQTIQVRQPGVASELDFEAWLAAYFTADEILAFGADSTGADPDLDGDPNETEWWLGHAPDVFSSRLRYDFTVEDKTLRLRFDEVEPAKATIRVEARSSLSEWSEDGVLTEHEAGELPRFSIGLGAEPIFVRARVLQK